MTSSKFRVTIYIKDTARKVINGITDKRCHQVKYNYIVAIRLNLSLSASQIHLHCT